MEDVNRILQDERWMEVALDEARSRLGFTWPNPTVGAVVVRGDRMVGRGAHPKAGEAHAEVIALQQAGAAAEGATLYVTLEPCSHHGRTPPCTQAILEAGIARVVVATPDPHPNVRGRGLEQLRAEGLDVTVGVKAAEAIRLNEPFFTHAVHGRPWVTWKSAMTLDGNIATASGHSRWITGPTARQAVHCLRAKLPAIMVGVGTVLTDNPLLTARDDDRPLDPERQPLRIIADTDARTPPSARLLTEPGETLIACGEGAPTDRIEALQRAGATVVTLPRDAEGRVALPALMEALAARDVVGVLLEGGATLAGSMFAQDLVDEVIVHIAPLLVGGDGPGPLRGPGAETMDQARRLYELSWEHLGRDVQWRGTLRPFEDRRRDYFSPGLHFNGGPDNFRSDGPHPDSRRSDGLHPDSFRSDENGPDGQPAPAPGRSGEVT